MDGQEKLQELVHLPRTWPLARLTIPLEGLSKQIDRLLEGYCFQILATNRNPEAHNGRVLQTATHLTWILAEYLADTIAWLMRSILGHATKILFDKDTQLLLTPKFWILPLYREFLNSARRIRPSPSSERARGCTGLVKIICKENKEQKGKRKYGSGPTMRHIISLGKMTPKSGLPIHHTKNLLLGKSKVNASQRMTTEATRSSCMGQKRCSPGTLADSKGKTV